MQSQRQGLPAGPAHGCRTSAALRPRARGQLSLRVPLTSRLPGSTSEQRRPVGLNYMLTYLGGCRAWVGAGAAGWPACLPTDAGTPLAGNRSALNDLHACCRCPPAPRHLSADEDMLIGRAQGGGGVFVFTRDDEAEAEQQGWHEQ